MGFEQAWIKQTIRKSRRVKSRGSDFEEATQVKYRVARRKINTSFEGRNRIGVFSYCLSVFRVQPVLVLSYLLVRQILIRPTHRAKTHPTADRRHFYL